MIVADPRILSDEWMLIGRQEQTDLSGTLDLLAVAPDSSLVLIEKKRKKTLVNDNYSFPERSNCRCPLRSFQAEFIVFRLSH
jgi:hypothetical protein